MHYNYGEFAAASLSVIRLHKKDFASRKSLVPLESHLIVINNFLSSRLCGYASSFFDGKCACRPVCGSGTASPLAQVCVFPQWSVPAFPQAPVWSFPPDMVPSSRPVSRWFSRPAPAPAGRLERGRDRVERQALPSDEVCESAQAEPLEFLFKEKIIIYSPQISRALEMLKKLIS